MSVRLLAVVVVAALAASGCVRFQEARLYDGFEPVENPERPRTLALAVEPTIFSDQADDTVWFQDDTNCTQGEVTSDIVYDGTRAVAVSWDRAAEGCEWAGLGFGWDNWVGKDLSEILPYAAVQMRVRAKEGRMFGLPIVLTLEDYSGGMGFAYTDNKYFERTFIDEEWQTVTVPLSSFDLEVENLDPTNVKQLMFELQQSGSIYIDDVRLIYYEAPELEPWITAELRPDPTSLPITLFGDSFINDNGWGLVTDACQSIQLEEGAASQGATVLHLRWDATVDGCYRGEMGVSWDKWYPVDVTSIAETAAIQLDVRLAEGRAESVPVQVGLQDYNRQTSSVRLSGAGTPAGALTTEWQTVTIPFSDLDGGADLSNIKQFSVTMQESGELFLDNIRLVARD